MKKKLTHHLMRAALGLFVMMLTANLGWAQSTLSGLGTQSDPYLIQSDADWGIFVDWINNHNSIYGSSYYKLTADISVSTMAATSSSNSFKGTFDGNGHTMALDLATTGQYCAPFRYVKAATFTRLHVTGTINTSSQFAGGIIAKTESGDPVSISNCWSSVTINSTTLNNCYHGGFVGQQTSSILVMTNCRFDGAFIGTSSTHWSGFVANRTSSQNLSIVNGLFAPTTININSNYSYTFTLTDYLTLTNCYYTEALKTAQGTAVGEMTLNDLQEALGSGWVVANNKVVPVMVKENLNAGSITCNEFFAYTGEGINVNPTVKDMDGQIVDPANYTISISPTPVLDSGDYTMTVTGNTSTGYSGTLTHVFHVYPQLDGAGTEASPFTIATTDEWNTFATAVANGYSYEGEYVRLTDNITISTMVGVRDNYPFKGTFDGYNNTLTANIVSTATGTGINEQGVAPFHYIYGATIKNLTVAGQISSNSYYTAGIVGFVDGISSTESHIIDCVVTATLILGTDYAGGIIGNGQVNVDVRLPIEIKNCVFAGTIRSNSTVSRANIGGFWCEGDAYYSTINCLEKGTYQNISMMHPRGYKYASFASATDFYYFNDPIPNNNSSYNLTNCYKVYATAPEDNIYLHSAPLHGYDFYQYATLTGLDPAYPYNNGNAINLNYTLKMSGTTMVEGTDYEVTIIDNSNNQSVSNPSALGDYTIQFTAKAGNTSGYLGQITASFSILEGESLDGYVFTYESSGGNKVYLINNESDLERLAAYVNSNHNADGLTFKLNADITMQGTHTAIGDVTYMFKGTFNGNNKTITNLTINKASTDYQGLFGYIYYGKVQNLTLDNCNIAGKNNTGGIAGYIGGSSSNYASIEGCTVSGTIAGTNSSSYNHGGIAGYAKYASITNCTVAGTLTSNNNQYYGGVVGHTQYATITNCENSASITGTGRYHGGIVGYVEYSYDLQITQCLNLGTVEGSSNVGGVGGQIGSFSWYDDCYYATPCNVGAVNGEDRAGRAERAYEIKAGEHVTNITISGSASVTSRAGKKYYKAGNWTPTITLESGYTLIEYVCEGGTLNTSSGLLLTIPSGSTTDVTISAIASSNNGTPISQATIEIPDQRWRGTMAVVPKVINVTYNNATLVEGTDYLVTGYNNNTGIGTATATLIGINDYNGTTTANFNIVDFLLLWNNDPENSETNPYLIRTEEDLQALACIVNTNSRTDGFYRQTENITLTEEHTPIGSYANISVTSRFQGSYDGYGNTISGLIINQPNGDYMGLFGCAYWATFKNIIINNCDITARKYVGGIVGYCNGNTQITDCRVSGAIKTADGVYGEYHGGIVGQLFSNPDDDDKVERCVNTANISSNASHSIYYGGIAGANHRSVTDCFNAGEVTGYGGFTGSIVGKQEDGATLTGNYHLATTMGGVGRNGYSDGADQTGAEVVVKITAGEGVTLTLPTASYVWNGDNLYQSGTVVTLDYTVPTGMVFHHYAVNSGEISNPTTVNGEHTLTDFNQDVVITGNLGVTLTVAGYNPDGTGDDDLTKWVFIASPVSGSIDPTTVSGLVPRNADGDPVIDTADYDLYRFNQSADLEWENYKVHNSDTENPFNTLVNGKGYLYASKNDVTLIFTGTFNSEEPFGVTLNFDEGMEFAGWNLVGNPFPEAATIDRSYYKISEDGKRVDPTEHSESIPACTGVMVHAESTSDNTVTFNRSRTQNMVNNGVLHIDIAQNNMRSASTGSATVDKAIVSFNEGDQLPKFVFNKDYAKVYIPQGNKDYAIVSTEKQGEMPLNFEATENGSFTLTVNPEGVEMSYLHLVDNMTGTDTDLLASPSYTFQAKTTDYASRFRLVFVTRDASTGSASDETFAFFSNGNWIISNEGEATLQVIDINGRVLSNEQINGSVSTTINAVPGVYVLRLINGENVRTQKVVVR